jgi:hypothetical protein
VRGYEVGNASASLASHSTTLNSTYLPRDGRVGGEQLERIPDVSAVRTISAQGCCCKATAARSCNPEQPDTARGSLGMTADAKNNSSEPEADPSVLSMLHRTFSLLNAGCWPLAARLHQVWKARILTASSWGTLQVWQHVLHSQQSLTVGTYHSSLRVPVVCTARCHKRAL